MRAAAHEAGAADLCPQQLGPIMSDTTASCQEFEVTVRTSAGPTCGTFSHLWLTLIGSQGETRPVCVTEGNSPLLPGSVSFRVLTGSRAGVYQYLKLYFESLFLLRSQTCSVQVQASGSLGRLILVRLRLEPQTGFPSLDWHCSRVEVSRRGKGQRSEAQVFLCDRWLQAADGDVELRSGKCEPSFVLSDLQQVFITCACDGFP